MTCAAAQALTHVLAADGPLANHWIQRRKGMLVDGCMQQARNKERKAAAEAAAAGGGGSSYVIFLARAVGPSFKERNRKPFQKTKNRQ